MISNQKRKLKPRNLKTIYKNIEEIRIANTILKTIFGVYAAFLVAIGSAIYTGDTALIIVILVGAIFQTVPILLLYKGQLRLSSLIFILIIVFIMTITAINGQGIHDIALLSFPVAIFFANLVMQRRDFFWASFLVLLAVGYLGFGELFGWFIPKNFNESIFVDFVIAIVILILAITIADSLAENIRKNSLLAQKEIALRKKAQAELQYLNIHDKLTGIHNRAFFDDALKLMEQSGKYPVSIVFADIDNLKDINDGKGHSKGDHQLKRTANILKSAIRSGDFLARIGGDEFAFILPQTDSSTANIVLSRVRAAISNHNAMNLGLQIQISLGISTAEKGKLEKALKIADRRMYEDKATRKSN